MCWAQQAVRSRPDRSAWTSPVSSRPPAVAPARFWRAPVCATFSRPARRRASLLRCCWRYLFWIQGALCALAALMVVLRLPESHPGSNRAIHPVAVVKFYAAIARDRRFLGYVMASTLSGAGLYVYLTGWPH